MKLRFALPDGDSFFMGWFTLFAMAHAFQGSSLAFLDFAVVVVGSMLRFRSVARRQAAHTTEINSAYLKGRYEAMDKEAHRNGA